MAVSGSQKFAVLLCMFRDTQSSNVQSPDYFRDLFVERGTGGLNDYWIDISHGNINLDGSQVYEWTVLEETQADYKNNHPSRWDKIQGAIDAYGVDMTQFDGVVAIFNADPGDSAASGIGVLAGPTNVNVTWMAHETGHVLSLEHSYDQSDRKLMTWSAPGEYYDRFDVMSAMNVRNFNHPRFNQSGPGLNAANLDRMGWLPAGRVWRMPHRNSSVIDTFDLVSLSTPERRGLLAAQIGPYYLEFRTPDNWDAGIPFAGVLIHVMSGDNSVVIASDLKNNVNHWQPGQVFGPSELELAIHGGTRIIIESFDLAAKKARISVTYRAYRPLVAGPARVFGGVTVGGGGVIILPDGRPVPVPPDSPLMNVLQKLAIMADAEQYLGSAASELVREAVLSDLAGSLPRTSQGRYRF